MQTKQVDYPSALHLLALGPPPPCRSSGLPSVSSGPQPWMCSPTGLEQLHRQRCPQALMGRLDLAGADTTPNVVDVNQLVGDGQLALEEIVEPGNDGIEQGLVLVLHLADAGFCDGLQLQRRRGRSPTGAVAACGRSSISPQPCCRHQKSGYRVRAFSSSSASLLAAASTCGRANYKFGRKNS